MSRQDGRPVSRRSFLRTAAGTAAVAGASGTAAAQEGGGASVTVDVVNYAYNPGTEEPLVIPPGTTVNWVWETDGHNIVVESQPSGANWSGHEPLEDTGFEYSHTFSTTGEYAYYCQPHRSLGMEATLRVEEGAPVPGQGETGYQTVLPDSAKTIGVASIGGMASVLGLTYFFIKYGGDYHLEEE